MRRNAMRCLMKRLIILFCFGLLVTACAHTRGNENDNKSTSGINEQNRACAPNFTVDGSFFSGKTFKCSNVYLTLSKTKAFDIILESIAANGLQIINSNKESGLISAAQGVSGRGGNAVPLNVIVKKLETRGVRVEATIRAAAGILAPDSYVEDRMCMVFERLK